MALRLGIGTNMRIQEVPFSWSRYWANHLFGQDDLNFWVKENSRNGLTLTDSVNPANSPSILTPVYKATAVNYLYTSGGILERIFNGGSYTIYFKIKQLIDISASQAPVYFGTQGAAQRGFLMYTASTNLYQRFADGTTNSEAVVCTNINTTFKNADWIEVFIEIDKIANRARFSMFKFSDGSALGSTRNVNISTWNFSDVDNPNVLSINNDSYAYCDFKKFTGLKTIVQCRDNSYVTDIQFYYPTVCDGTDVSGNAHHALFNGNNYFTNRYYSSISTYCFDYGYSLLRSVWKWNYPTSAGYIDIYIPNNPLGIAIARTINDSHPTARIKVGDYAGNLTGHNLADCLLDIPGDSWNKSNIDIFEDVVRTGFFYDAANPNRWHPSELDYLLFSQRCKTNHKGLNFFKITDNSLATEDRKMLSEIFSYVTDKTGNDLQKILQYIGDKTAISNCIQLYCNASVNQNIYLKIGGFINTQSLQIYWGDGTKRENITMDDTEQTLYHIYTGTGIYPIFIINPENISYLFVGESSLTFDVAPANYNINEFYKAVNLKNLFIHYISGIWIGSINGLSIALEYLSITPDSSNTPESIIGYNHISGSITKFINIKKLYLGGGNSIIGNGDGMLELTHIYVMGQTAITLDVTLLTEIIFIEKTHDHSYYYGDITGLIQLQQLCVNSPHNLFGDITSMSNLKYISGNGLFTGDISGLTKIYVLGGGSLSTFTGSFTNLTKLQMWDGSSYLTLTKVIRLNNNPKICFFNSPYVYTSAEVNQLLADVWASRNDNKTDADGFTNSYRVIGLNAAGSGAPTGQGLIDKAALQAYSSPTPPGTAALWTINTN